MASLVPAVVFAAIVACGSAYFALLDPPATSRAKIIFAGVLCLGFLLALVGWRWIVGEEDLSGATLLVGPIAVIGVVVCISSVVGTLIGTKWRRNRP
jgi:hypothetical protein